MKRLGINTLVYKQQLDRGIAQSELLTDMKKYASIIEIRREYILSKQEMDKIRNTAVENNLELYYSVPDKITVNKQLNSKFRDYLQEAQDLNCTHIKFNIGDLQNCNQDVIEQIDVLSRKNELIITIENDQTTENGSLNCAVNTLNHLKKFNSSIGYTFDIGNWCWQKENPTEAFKTLKDFISIIHLKTVNDTKNPATVLLEDGCLPWQNMVVNTAEDTVVFLEYPIESKYLPNEIEIVSKYL